VKQATVSALLCRVLGNQLLGQIIEKVARFHRTNDTGTGY
jgi:hypothetical protein